MHAAAARLVSRRHAPRTTPRCRRTPRPSSMRARRGAGWRRRCTREAALAGTDVPPPSHQPQRFKPAPPMASASPSRRSPRCRSRRSTDARFRRCAEHGVGGGRVGCEGIGGRTVGGAVAVAALGVGGARRAGVARVVARRAARARNRRLRPRIAMVVSDATSATDFPAPRRAEQDPAARRHEQRYIPRRHHGLDQFTEPRGVVGRRAAVEAIGGADACLRRPARPRRSRASEKDGECSESEEDGREDVPLREAEREQSFSCEGSDGIRKRSTWHGRRPADRARDRATTASPAMALLPHAPQPPSVGTSSSHGSTSASVGCGVRADRLLAERQQQCRSARERGAHRGGAAGETLDERATDRGGEQISGAVIERLRRQRMRPLAAVDLLPARRDAAAHLHEAVRSRGGRTTNRSSRTRRAVPRRVPDGARAATPRRGRAGRARRRGSPRSARPCRAALRVERRAAFRSAGRETRAACRPWSRAAAPEPPRSRRIDAQHVRAPAGEEAGADRTRDDARQSSTRTPPSGSGAGGIPDGASRCFASSGSAATARPVDARATRRDRASRRAAAGVDDVLLERIAVAVRRPPRPPRAPGGVPSTRSTASRWCA